MSIISQFWIAILVVPIIFHVLISAEISNSEGDNTLIPSNSTFSTGNATGVVFDEEDSRENLKTSHDEILLANIALQKRVTTLENRVGGQTLTITPFLTTIMT